MVIYQTHTEGDWIRGEIDPVERDDKTLQVAKNSYISVMYKYDFISMEAFSYLISII